MDAGVAEENIKTIVMSADVDIAALSPGDTLTVRYGYSIGSADGAIPLFPSEGLVKALEINLFADAASIPEPSSFSTFFCGLLLCIARRRFT